MLVPAAYHRSIANLQHGASNHGFRVFAQGEGPAEEGAGLHGEPRLSQPEALQGRGGRRRPLAAGRPHRGAEEEGARRGALEPVPARVQARRGAHQPGIRAAVRDHGPGGLGARGVQLLGARHRQHGDHRALRHGGAEARMARSAAGGKDPLLLCHDRAARGLLGRHQHREPHRAPRRQLHHQRPQMVVVRARPTRAASCSSSWARPIRAIRTATSSSR